MVMTGHVTSHDRLWHAEKDKLMHFPAIFLKFQIFLEQSNFVVQKRLVYEKAFIWMKNMMKQKLSDLLNF